MTAERAVRPRLTATLCAGRGAFRLSAAVELGDEPLAIIGPNGSGKTTLLLALLGALPAAEGQILLDDDVLLDSARHIDVPVEDRRLAYVPQDFGLLPHLGAASNIEFALACRRTPPRTRRQEALALLRRFGIEPLADRAATELSGGEKQRVALARALASSPRALLLDEPTSALDAGAREEVRRLLAAEVAARRLSVIVVTHDLADVLALTTRVAVMDQGRIVACGGVDELRRHPPTDFAAGFFARPTGRPPHALGWGAS